MICVFLQANYQLILPDIETYLEHIGAASSWAGIAIGCCDVATLPGALGHYTYLWHHHCSAHSLLAVTAASQAFRNELCCPLW